MKIITFIFLPFFPKLLKTRLQRQRTLRKRTMMFQVLVINTISEQCRSCFVDKMSNVPIKWD